MVLQANRLANDSAARSNADPRTAHVGFYLIDAGRPLLESAIHTHRSIVTAMTGLASRFPTFVYLGAVAVQPS